MLLRCNEQQLFGVYRWLNLHPAQIEFPDFSTGLWSVPTLHERAAAPSDPEIHRSATASRRATSPTPKSRNSLVLISRSSRTRRPRGGWGWVDGDVHRGHPLPLCCTPPYGTLPILAVNCLEPTATAILKGLRPYSQSSYPSTARKQPQARSHLRGLRRGCRPKNPRATVRVRLAMRWEVRSWCCVQTWFQAAFKW